MDQTNNNPQDSVTDLPQIFSESFQTPEPPEPPLSLKIKWAAENQIRKYYPEYKQLNTLMEGNEVEIAKMRAFIQAVRDWSNGPNPDLTVVTTIVPQS